MVPSKTFLSLCRSPSIVKRGHEPDNHMISVIDPRVDERWDNFVLSHPDSTIFHHSAWARVLAERYDSYPNYYILENEHGEVIAAAPFFQLKRPIIGKRMVCLPCSELCFPLGNSHDDLKLMMDHVVAGVDSDSFSYLEIRGWGKQGLPVQLGLKERPSYLTHVVDLSDGLERLRSRMARNARYNLRYGQKSPVSIREGQDEDDLKEFHRLSVATRQRLNLLPWPYRFFQSIYRHIILPGHGYFSLAEVDGRVVAANMYFCFKDTITHKFHAADEQYLNYRPNYVLIWHAMERAYQESYRYYHFGVTDLQDKNLARFKRQWGSREATMLYYYYPNAKGLSSLPQDSLTYRAYTRVNSWLPEFALKLASEALYKYMG
jgi:hypothetical protein